MQETSVAVAHSEDGSSELRVMWRCEGCKWCKAVHLPLHAGYSCPKCFGQMHRYVVIVDEKMSAWWMFAASSVVGGLAGLLLSFLAR